MGQISNIVADRAPVIASVLVVVAGVLLATQLFGSSSIPLIGREYGYAEKRRKAFIKNGMDFYTKGYELFKNRAYRLTALDGERIVLPRSLIEEVRRLPDDIIDIQTATDMNMEHKVMKVGNKKMTDFFIHIIRADLTHGLGRINSRLVEEVRRTVAEVLPPCEDWTPTVVYPEILRIVATTSGSIFVGTEHCRSEEYLHASMNYTLSVFDAIKKLKQWNRWIRWVGRYFTPEVDKMFSEKEKSRRFLTPIIQQRRAAMKAGGEVPDDTLQWMVNQADEFNLSDDELAESQLNLSMASIHTTTLTITLLLYDLAVRQNVIAELRDEIKTVLAANGGIMTTHALFEMKLLDSAMKESQRMNPGSLIRFPRYVAKPVTLSDGTRLPAGSMIETPHALAMTDSTVFENPEEWDAHRFVNLRNGTSKDLLGYKNKEQYQFATVTKDFMHFGYGRHACPGRFFAAHVIKLIVARLLLEYDIKMPEGVTERYPNLVMGIDSMPDPTKELVFKKVATSVA
ncbi:cytochrome P450 [Xylariaceae sp. FL0662B]|nr:cytochrome P450 [Xylariaceae sp. FL0662B]